MNSATIVQKLWNYCNVLFDHYRHTLENEVSAQTHICAAC
jgi:hypothetical protein